ncbi:MAG: host attachment protein [Verrucomicrobiales bacterium]|nr:host attachment protein [Verrucomicrobiales bacterium]
MVREQEKRQQQKIAETINGIVHSHENIPWRLVAPAPLLNALDHFLDAEVKENLLSTESGDWTGFDIEEMKKRINSL